MRRLVGLAAAAVLSLPALAAAQPQPDLGSAEQVAAGKVVYDKWCAHCHGDAGDGEGVAAPHLQPRPRDFTAGKYKFRSTPFGALPTEADLHRSIRNGLPGTSMPAFANLSEDEVADVIDYLKTFADDWQDPAAYAEAVALPSPPAYSAERAEEGRQVYFDIGCARCHGDEGRGDGGSAPTLQDDWGHFIRVADLTMPWTFRGGATREDVFRTLTTGVYGTPMAAFGDALTEDQRWAIVDWIVSQAGGDPEQAGQAPYTRLVQAQPVDGALDFDPDPAKVRDMFAAAPAALFPVIGQVMQPGRAFHPAARAVEVRAVFNRDDIAFLVSWHDMSAERDGENRPDLPVEEATEAEGAQAAPAGNAPADPFAAEEAAAADPFAADEAAAADPFAADTAPADPFAADAAAGDPFAAAAAPSAPVSPWSDAVALQFPVELRPGVAKPYFLFGDATYPVELWHVDLARPAAANLYEGRGSDSLSLLDRPAPEVVTFYDKGRWSVAFKRPRTPSAGIAFADDTFVPLAATVWDGFQGEHGNTRGLTAWYNVYVPPLNQPSPLPRMLRAGLGVLGLELLIIAWVRRRQRRLRLQGDGVDAVESQS